MNYIAYSFFEILYTVDFRWIGLNLNDIDYLVALEDCAHKGVQESSIHTVFLLRVNWKRYSKIEFTDYT